MKILPLLLLGFFAPALALADPIAPVKVTLGPSTLAPGDVLIIREVLSTSPALDIGDKVIVRGRFVLRSREEAKLGVGLTQTEGGVPTPIQPKANRLVSQGAGEFELEFEVKHVGCLHVSLSNPAGGKFFSRQYFGTPAQVARVSR